MTGRPGPDRAVWYEGREFPAAPGMTIAAALLAGGVPAWRTTRRHQLPRGVFCGIGQCFDCLVDVEGAGPVRACQEIVAGGTGIGRSRSVGNPGAGAAGGDWPPSRHRSPGGPPDQAAQPRLRADVAVVGAGPAGMAAALAAADAGCQVVVADSAPLPGGQIYRQGPAGGLPPRFRRVGSDPRITVAAGVHVWHAERHADGFALHCDGRARLIEAAALVLATGAAELVFPFPGWTLPGVMTAGGAQALLKGQGVLAGRRVLVAGTGPLLLPVAASLARRGALALACEATGPGRLAAAAGAVARHPARMAQAAGYAAVLASHGARIRPGWAVLGCSGGERVTAARIGRVDGSGHPVGPVRQLAVDAVAVSHGLVPAIELARSLGCRDLPVPGRPAAAIAVDGRQATSVRGVFACGEATGIGGVAKAEPEGTVAGAAAACHLGRLTSQGFQAAAGAALRRLRRARRFAGLLDGLYPAAGGWMTSVEPGTVVCRCEEVTWSEVTAAVAAGAGDVRAVKGLTRCGMGYCQARVCGPLLQQAVAHLSGRPLETVGDLHTRHIAQPVMLSRLAEAAGAAPAPRSRHDRPGGAPPAGGPAQDSDR